MSTPEGNFPSNTGEQVLIDQQIAEEKSNINYVKDQVLELQARLQAKLRESILKHHERIRELNHQRNMHSAVMRLPPEILHKIFQHLQGLYRAESAKDGNRTSKWCQVLYVCQHWRSLAIDSSSLWTTIYIPSKPSRWSELALGRSGTAILDVFLMLPTSRNNRNRERLIEQNIARIRTLDIHGDVTNIIIWDKFQAFLNTHGANNVSSGETTTLERLSIRLVAHSSVPNVSKAWFAIAPHLRHLKLSGIGLDWTTPHFRHLRTLHVMAVPAVTQLTLDKIQSVFGKMSLLEDLHLSNIFRIPREDGALPPTPSTKCNLPKLKKLHIESASSSSIALFLLSMSFPNLDRFHIEVPLRGSNPNDHSYFFRALSMLRQHAYHTISIQNIYVDGHCENIAFGMYLDKENEGSQILLPVSDSEVMNLQMITNFCTVTDLTRLKHLLVEDMLPQALKSNFGSLPHLSSIVTLGNETFTDLVAALMIPLEYPQYAQLTFPGLKSISATHLAHFTDKDAAWELLQDCLMQRYEYGTPVDDLELLLFSMCPLECVVKLSEIVPHVTVAKMPRRALFWQLV